MGVSQGRKEEEMFSTLWDIRGVYSCIFPPPWGGEIYQDQIGVGKEIKRKGKEKGEEKKKGKKKKGQKKKGKKGKEEKGKKKKGRKKRNKKFAP